MSEWDELSLYFEKISNPREFEPNDECSECGHTEFDERFCKGCGLLNERIDFELQIKPNRPNQSFYLFNWLKYIQCFHKPRISESFLDEVRNKIEGEIKIQSVRSALKTMRFKEINKTAPYILHLLTGNKIFYLDYDEIRKIKIAFLKVSKFVKTKDKRNISYPFYLIKIIEKTIEPKEKRDFLLSNLFASRNIISKEEPIWKKFDIQKL
jgi:hypothetical protein